MKSFKRKWSIVLLLSVICNCLHAQIEEEGVNPAEEEKAASTYIGVGIGFDYGGVGGKVEYLPGLPGQYYAYHQCIGNSLLPVQLRRLGEVAKSNHSGGL
jgi:hypothetical protein